MPVGKPLHLRLFLEGEEVPVISAQVSANVGAPATAAIQVIPLDEAMDILPRTMVHLFFLDTRVDTSIGPNAWKSDVRGEYRLLFSGEFVSFAYSQTPASRGLVLQCMDFSNYWDSAHVMAIAYGPNGNAFTNDGALNGAALGVFTDIPGDSAAEKLVKWVSSKPVTPGLTKISGLAGGVIHIMEAMGGVPGHFKGVNDFYTIAELRCRLLNQITAEENDSTAARVLSINVFHEWLKNGIEQAGGNITFRDVMKLLFNYIYYEFVPNPAPKFDDATTNKVPGTPKSKLSANPVIRGVTADLVEVQTDTYITLDLDTYTRRSVEWIRSLTSVKERLDSFSKTSVEVKKASGFVDQALSALAKVSDPATAAISGWAFNITDVRLAVAMANAAVKRAIDILGSGTLPGSSGLTESTSQRLRTQIVRPDCWFASPPACNVIFPEMYAQITYDRNYLQETTRLLVHGFNTLIGRDHLMASHILSPLNAMDGEKLAKFKGSKSMRVLMDHEVHVGIIPRTEWIPNTAGIGNSLDSAQLKKVKDGRLSWMIKASLFHFFKYRFAARQVSVAGRFNPFLVVGFPGAVITRPYNIPGGVKFQSTNGKQLDSSSINDLIDSKATEFNAPSHFVGLIGGLQHMVDQTGGTTSVSMHHARRHRGIDDEFVGVMVKTDEGKATRIVPVILDRDSSDPKVLKLLVGVTPQVDEGTVPDFLKPILDTLSKVTTETSTQDAKAVSATAAGIVAATKAGITSLNPTASTFKSTQTVEKDSVSPQSGSEPDPPPRTVYGSIPAVDLTHVKIPLGSTSIKVNDKKGYYGGKIVGIKVEDANIDSVSYTTTTTTAAVGATGSEGQTVLVSPAKTSTKTSNGVAFKTVIVYEEVTISVPGTLPIEEIVRPAWFSTAYASVNIGKKIYEPFFGCGAVVDSLITPGASTSAGVSASSDPEPVSAATSAKDLLAQLTVQETEKRTVTVEKALNILGYVYGQVKTEGQDVEAFLRDYTDRPIATMREIFGDSDLTFTIVDSAVGGDVKVNKVTPPGGGAPVTPMVGFHTAAVHPQLVGTVENGGKLVGLTTDLSNGFKRVNGVGASEPLVTAYDVRPKKKAKVMAYVTALGVGPAGFRG